MHHMSAGYFTQSAQQLVTTSLDPIETKRRRMPSFNNANRRAQCFNQPSSLLGMAAHQYNSVQSWQQIEQCCDPRFARV